MKNNHSHSFIRSPFVVLGAISAAAVVPPCALLTLLILDHDFALVAIRTAVVLLLVALSAALALLLLWLYRRAQRAAVVTMQHGQPVHLADLRTLTRATAAATLERHYAAELARAERSAFPALSHYSVRGDAGSPALPPIEGEVVASPADPAPALPAFAAGTSRLAQLQAWGHLSGDPPRLFVGYAASAPQSIPLASAGFIAVAGQPRTGKTTTVSLLLAQAALAGWHIAICDPHGHQDEGLLRRCRAISGSCIRQAIAPAEIIEAISLVDKIGRCRLAGDRADAPVLLVIDEFTKLALRRELPADTLATLVAMAVEHSKVKIHGLIIGQDWTGDLLGAQLGPPLRRAITHRVIHRIDPQNAEFLLPFPALARRAATLERGSALLWGDDPPVTVGIPLLTEDDMRYAAQGRPLRPYAPRPVQIAAAPPPPPPSLDDRIVDLLARGGGLLDGNTIATQLGADILQVRNALTRLAQTGRVARHGQPRSYTYAVSGS